ncbi:MAG TPA: hypothetical protein VI488_05835 [Candidatus Angelobacter sp.]
MISSYSGVKLFRIFDGLPAAKKKEAWKDLQMVMKCLGLKPKAKPPAE